MTKYTLQIYHQTFSVANEDTWVDFNTLEIHPETVQELINLGIVEVRQGQLPAYQIMRVQKILRLHNNLGINLQGAAVILDLLEKVETLNNEIERLKRR